jgi:hypothetical protein
MPQTFQQVSATELCPSCNALYQVVKAEAGPETVALEIACPVCSSPLVAREGKFVVKYFLLRKAASGPRKSGHTAIGFCGRGD